MENVAKELYDLIDQYRADPKRNINPFSMRLQGIIDANVMGGISKYQDAFFTEQFTKSAEGKAQQSNVQRLKSLLMEQVQILDKALELHGNLAPEGVQPLHKRLLERYIQMKQSLTGMERIKRQFSESIVNTPLPPLPVEKRSNSLSCPRSTHSTNDISDDLIDDHSNYHMMNFEKEEIYTRPSRLQNENYELRQPLLQRCLSNQNQSHIQNGSFSCDSIASAPPVPIRPKSAGYGNYDSPEIPPKLSTKDILPNVAPPLPPRGQRSLNAQLGNFNSFNSSHSLDHPENELHMTSSSVKSTLQKYSIVNISLDDQAEADHDRLNIECFEQQPPIDFRDSGISTTSHDLNYAFICSDLIRTTANGSSKTNGTNGVNNFNDQISGSRDHVDSIGNENGTVSTPPPIPRKSTGSLGFGMNHSNSSDDCTDRRSTQIQSINDDNEEPGIDGYCVPKISNKNNH